MDTIIGLGSAGCNIADCFAEYPQYTVYKIDNNVYGKNCYFLPKFDSPEEYEAHVGDLSSLLAMYLAKYCLLLEVREIFLALHFACLSN